MNPIYHDMRSYRKKTCLSQQDVAELFGSKDVSQISRYETCPINPQVQVSLLYHLIFNVPMNMFFERQKEVLRKKLITRIPNIIHELNCLPPNALTNEKIAYLHTLFETLTHPSL